MLWMVGAPLVSLVKSVAGGAGSIASGVAKGIGKAVSGADKEQTAKVAASGAPAGGNGENAVIGDESSVSEMFGGLDLTKVKSALEDEGPMGPPEEGPKTVYKIMIGVLQGMAQTLLRMEATMKMLLAIEYERVKGIVAQTAQESIAQSKIPDGDEGGGKRGILGRGKDMLGGAWNKAKDSPTWLKMLGLTGLLVAIKFWKDDLEKAVAKILEWFTKAYEYFTADDFGWEKFKTDWVDKFYPKMKGILMGALDWLWRAIKNITAEFILGARGDKAIKQQTSKRERSVESLKEMTDLISKSGGATGTMSYVGGKVQFQKKGLEALGFTEFDLAGNVKGARKGEFQAFQNSLTDAVDAMTRLSGESDGRIQFLGFPDMTDVVKVSAALRNGSIGINEILNAVPIIDGNIATMEDLKSFGLHRSAGTTKEMNQANVEMIHENLAEMTQLTKMMQSITGMVDAGGTNIGKFKMNGEMYTMATAKQRFKDLLAENEIFGQLSPAEILELSGGNATSGIISIDGATSTSGEALKDAVKQIPTGLAPPSIINAPTDNSVKTNTTNQTITALNGKNDYAVQVALNEVTGVKNVFGYT